MFSSRIWQYKVNFQTRAVNGMSGRNSGFIGGLQVLSFERESSFSRRCLWRKMTSCLRLETSLQQRLAFSRPVFLSSFFMQNIRLWKAWRICVESECVAVCLWVKWSIFFILGSLDCFIYGSECKIWPFLFKWITVVVVVRKSPYARCP